MVVAGTPGVVRHVKVKLLGLTHTFPDDLDIAVQAPSGRTMWLTSDAGGIWDVSNLDVTFDTQSQTPVPDEDPLGAGPYAPTDYENGESLPSPAPPPPARFARTDSDERGGPDPKKGVSR